jgi:RNA 2',3'-cyclic 3'-phosphodiesterase
MSHGATARLFVAVDPPPAVCERLAAWAREVALGPGLGPDAGKDRRLRLLEARALHLTLCFLGSRPVAEVDGITTALDACEAPVGELLVGAPLWLPPRRPRALAVAIVDREGELARLQAMVLDAVAGAIDWQPGRRRFRAHVTLARMSARAAGSRRPAGEEAPLPPTPPLGFTPRSVVLYRSWLSPTGAAYEALATRVLSP